MMNLIINKILLGISLAAPIGPVSIEMIKRGLIIGFWGSFNVRLGGAIANVVLLLLAYFGLNNLQQYPKIIFTISILGGLSLIYLGLKSIGKSFKKQTLNALKNTLELKSKYSVINGLLVGFSLSLFCPISLIFWLSTFAATATLNDNTTFSLHDLLINLFIIFGILLWGIFVSSILHFFNKFIDEKKLSIITFLSGLILIYFGIKYVSIIIK